MRPYFSALAVPLLMAPAQAQRGNPTVEFEGESIDRMIALFMQEHRVPGMTLAIVQAPYVSRVVGYGTSNPAKALLASPKTLWNIGSMSQAYSAVAILQLVEAGKLSLDDPVGKHVAELPATWKPITVRQLMAHTSGLPDYAEQPGFDPARATLPRDLLASVAQVPLRFAPGTRVAAGATDRLLMRQLIAGASGVSYEEFVTEHQIRKLRLNRTTFASALGAVKQEAVEKNNLKHSEFLKDRAYIDPTEAAAGTADRDGKTVPAGRHEPGDLMVSAEDISLWDIGLAGGLLVADKSLRDAFYKPVNLSDGSTAPAHCGWRFFGHKGLMDIRGEAPGFSIYLSRFTDKSELVCVTLCANKEGLDLTELARKIAGAFDRRLGPPVSPKVMATRESGHSVPLTADRLEAFLRARGAEVSARIDHAAAAKKNGLDLPPSQVLILGNPAVDTHLMLARPAAALELPLRVAIWQEPDGTVWVGYHDPAELARRLGIEDRAGAVAKMRAGLLAAIAHATVPY